MANGICLQLTHTGVSGRASLYLSDLDTRENLPRSIRAAVPLYIPYLGTAVLAYSGDVAAAFETGSIRKFVDAGYLTAVFVLGTTFTAALPGTAFTQAEKKNLEMEMAYKAAYAGYHKVITYTGSAPTLIRIYRDVSLTEQLFSKALTYDGDTLTSMLTTRTSDGAVVLKTFTYAGDQVVGVTQVSVP